MGGPPRGLREGWIKGEGGGMVFIGVFVKVCGER